MSKIYDSADMLIGNTPLLRLRNTEKKYGVDCEIVTKLEMLNPCGSVKDRVGLSMIEEAEASGRLKKGSVIIEPTSGNTGIGIAAVAATRGYRAMIVMPENMSEERKTLMRAYGAELVLTPASEGMSGAIKRADELCLSIPGSIVAGQFVNPANPDVHFRTTGPEIYRDTDGKVDAFISTVGTGGTITGTGRYLKSMIPSVKVIAVEPSGSAVLSGKKAGAHKIQGIGAGFVPDVLDCSVYDEVVTVSDEEAFEYGRCIGCDEGILAGISSGAALCAAIKLAKREEYSGKNKRIVVLFPDTGDRYLSTELFK